MSEQQIPPAQMREIALDSIAYLRAIYDDDTAGACALYDTQEQPELLTMSLATLLAGAIRATGQAEETWQHLLRRAEDIR